MNFLAHIYLSKDDELITIGNFIADAVKGNKYKNYDKKIQLGILLHREIDTYTDQHPIFKQSTKRLHKNYSHYSGVIVDIFYDHFLAKNWTLYSNSTLSNYVDSFYQNLENHYDLLPKRIQNMLPYMIVDNWLLNYQYKEGIAKVLSGMNRRTKYKSGMNNAINDLEEFYLDFGNEFTLFFKDLIQYSNQKLELIAKELKIPIF